MRSPRPLGTGTGAPDSVTPVGPLVVPAVGSVVSATGPVVESAIVGDIASAVVPVVASSTDPVDPRRPLLSATPLPGLPPVAVHELAYDAYELGGFEGLGEEGVDADGDTAVHLVLGAGTDDGDRQMTGARIGPQPLGGAQPVQPGHDDVEGDDIRLHLMHDIQTLGTIGRGHDLEALKLEIDPDQLPDHPVVIDNEHPTGHA